MLLFEKEMIKSYTSEIHHFQSLLWIWITYSILYIEGISFDD